jgi:nucleotide-binding universal stress UspA family protein
MSRIVVGIDGSHHASRALDWAMGEAAVRKADLTVIAVNSVPQGYWTTRPVTLPGDADRVEEIRKSAQEAVDKSAAALGDEQPAAVHVMAFSGFPAKALIDESEKADLIVVGSRGGGGFGALFLGSVSSQVVHHAKCPVVVVPPSK